MLWRFGGTTCMGSSVISTLITRASSTFSRRMSWTCGKKMVRASQGLWPGDSLSSGKGQCCSRCFEQKKLCQHGRCFPDAPQVMRGVWAVESGFLASYFECSIRCRDPAASEGRWEAVGDPWVAKERQGSSFQRRWSGTLWYKNRICVPDVKDLRKLILSEAHDTAYSIHPSSTDYGGMGWSVQW